MSTSGAAPAGGPPSGAAGGDLGGAYPNPGVAKIQGTPVSAVAPTNGQLFELVGGVWTPSTLVIPAAGATVTGPDAFGAVAAVGVSTAYSRADHDHGLPAESTAGPAATVTGPDAFGAAAVLGASTRFARQDHDHGLPANPSAAFAAPAIALGTAAAAGVAATKIRSDATIVAFDATAPATQALGDAAAVGAAAVAARRDHKHGMPALASTVVGPDAFGAAAVVGTSALPARADHDHGLPANSPSLTSAQSILGASVSVAANTATNVTSLSLTAGTWLVMAHASITPTTSTGPVEIWLTTTSAGAGSTAVLSAEGFAASAGNPSLLLAFQGLVTPGATTTFFLVCESGLALTVQATTVLRSAPGATGLVAVKIA